MQGLTEVWPSSAAQNPSSSNGLRRLPGVYRLIRDDLVSVVPSDRKHMPLVKAMRGWRKVRPRPCCLF